MTEALENEVKNKVSIKEQEAVQFVAPLVFWIRSAVQFSICDVRHVLQGHLHTYRFCDNVWTFIVQNAQIKSEEGQETVGSVKIVACDSKLLTQ
ncbi:hypothetical protein SASPL_132023 [Salvia splendens]|uniref:Transcription initiation factor IIA gamma subunit C-terminal domain-containing protein n=1 Tax=Salvia splendens TaxID=180675 RepID=A0A8X8XB53_SALSN|nr:hypothetical protein SASPL_132023 [Salvia splendens]